MKRLVVLNSLAIALIAGNVYAWSSMRLDPTIPSGDCGCTGSEVAPNASEILDAKASADPGTDGPFIECVGCEPMGSTEQWWCQLRPDDTDCSIIWWNNNFYWVRWVHFYDCPGDDIAVCCRSWQPDGCCNNSGPPPQCNGGGVTKTCVEVQCP